MKRFLSIFDVHWGYERVNGHKKEIHNYEALLSVLRFAQEFKPHYLLWGGDILDCSPISHWNRNHARKTEGLRLIEDARGLGECMEKFRRTMAPGGEEAFLIGNHESWLDDFMDEFPALEGLLEIDKLLPLGEVKVVPQGESYRLGKLWFIHGDQIKGTANPAKYAVEAYGRSIRFGHFHTAGMSTRISALDQRDVHTAMAVPCLCKRGPGYQEGRPNRWTNGFLWGYIHKDGSFNDYLTVLVDDHFIAGGKVY